MYYWAYPLFYYKILKSNTMKNKSNTSYHNLFSNLYLWTIENNNEISVYLNRRVVICFQICIFGPLKTTKREKIFMCAGL